MVFEEDLSDPRASSTSVMFRSLDVSWRRRSRSRSRRRRRCTHPYILPTQPLRYRPNISVRSRISLCPPLASVPHLAISPSPFSSLSLSPILSVRMARTVLEERQGRYVRDRLIRSYGFYHGNAVLSIDRGLILGQNNIVSPSLAYPPRCPLASSHTHTRTERERGSAPRPATQPVNRRTDHARLRTAARSVLWVRQYGGREPVRLAGLQQRPGCNIGISAMPYPFVSIKFNLAQRISKYRFTSFRCRWE